MQDDSRRRFSAVAALAAGLLTTSAFVAAEPPTVPTRAERAAIDACLAPMPPRVQLAIAVLDGDAVRFLGVERTAEGSRLVDNRGAAFQIGSMTKVFTATLFADEVQRGELALDDTVQSRLPFKLEVSGRDGVEMTLRQLASHTSGIAHHQPPRLGFHAFVHGHADEPWKDYDQVRFDAYLREDLALAHTPGTRYLYSNIGMSLLGRILALRTGRSYETLLQERIFGPLGMSGSTTEIGRVRERVVVGLKANGRSFPNQDMAALTPSGGIFTCADDLAKFARAQFAPAPAAIALTQQPVFTIGEGYLVALGWHVVDWAEGWRWLNHNGGIGGYTTTINVDAKNHRAAVVLSNVMNDDVPGEKVRALGRALLKQAEKR